MPRPIKKGLPYFPVDTEWERNLKLFQAKFGVTGVGTIVVLWKWIYNEGYYLRWDDETRLLFSSENHVDEEDLTEMINFAVEKELFDKGLFKKYNVLTSRGIQKRYLNGCLKRTEVHLSKKLVLIDLIIPDWSKTRVIFSNNDSFLVSETPEEESETPQKESETPEKDSRSTQSRGSRVEEVKGRRKKIPKTPRSALPPAGHPPPGKPPPDEYENGITDIRAAIGTNPAGKPPGRSKDEQLREVASRLKKEDPEEYKKFLNKHPELEEVSG